MQFSSFSPILDQLHIFHQASIPRDQSRLRPALVIGFLLGGLSLATPLPAEAHGISTTYSPVSALQIEAQYSSGEPLANAQVLVFPPNESTPWLRGTTDESGRFTFTPDWQQEGNWEVQVRLAGHGEVFSIPIAAPSSAAARAAEDLAPSTDIELAHLSFSDVVNGGSTVPMQPALAQSSLGPSSIAAMPLSSAMSHSHSSLTWSQKAMMAALFAWGAIGTTLFVQARSSSQSPALSPAPVSNPEGES